MPVNCARSPAGARASVRFSFPLLLSGLSCLTACTGGDPPSDNAGAFAPCCAGLGSCIPLGLLPQSVAPRLEQAECRSALVCAPSAWVEDPSTVAPSCRGVGDVEGRCLPSCLPDVAALADRLEQASCSPGNLCVPCFDPLSGEDTRACRLGSDQPHEPANLFAHCCGDAGRCLPREALSQSLTEADLARLGPDACSSARPTLCVPEPWLDPAGARVDSCRAFGDFEGRCLPSCLPEIAARADTLAQDGCDRGQLCVPCFDPLSGEDTQACRVRGDVPREPARVYGRCCEQRGRCVPQEVLLQSVAVADTLLLDSDVCPSESQSLCVPERWLDGERAASSDLAIAGRSSQGETAPLDGAAGSARASSPADNADARVERCRALGDLEGRCLPSCLPAVAQQAAQLAQTSCAAGDLCVPCFDPLSGAESGACRVGDDRPRERVSTFDNCCGERGRCIPQDLLLQSVAESDLERLGRDRCRKRDSLCVPEPWLEPEGVRVDTCRAFGSLEGRCLPSCLPEVAGRARELRQEDCDRGDLCVPCFDPRTGEETAACSLGGDRPLEPARGFEPCCGAGSAALGSCVPVELLSRDQAASLPVDSCSDAGTRCAPSELLSPDGRLASCASFAFGFSFTPAASGLCVPECFVSPLLRTFVPQGSCTAPHRCVSCSSLGSSFPGCP